MGKKYVIDETTMKNIASEIRNRGGDFVGTDEMTPEEMVETKIGLVYHKGSYDGYKQGFSFGEEQGYGKGYEFGRREGEEFAYPIGLENGREAEWSEKWDSAQQNGNLGNHNYACAGNFWTDVTFDPKYDMRPTTAIGMFQLCACKDIVKALEKRGRKIDFSRCTTFTNMLSYCLSSTFPEVDASNASSIGTICANNSALKAFKIKISAKLTSASNAFQNCTALEDVEITGVQISINGFNFTSCPLTHDCLVRILTDYLADKSSVSGSWVFTVGPNNLAKLSDAEKAIATQKGWSLL